MFMQLHLSSHWIRGSVQGHNNHSDEDAFWPRSSFISAKTTLERRYQSTLDELTAKQAELSGLKTTVAEMSRLENPIPRETLFNTLSPKIDPDASPLKFTSIEQMVHTKRRRVQVYVFLIFFQMKFLALFRGVA